MQDSLLNNVFCLLTEGSSVLVGKFVLVSCIRQSKGHFSGGMLPLV